MSATLSKELAVYEQRKEELLADRGKYVVICDEVISEPMETYQDALQSGFDKFGLRPFLVKQIEAVERVHYLGHIAAESACER